MDVLAQSAGSSPDTPHKAGGHDRNVRLSAPKISDSSGSGEFLFRQQEARRVPRSSVVAGTFFSADDHFEAENINMHLVLPSELTDRRRLQLPCLTALFRGLCKLPSSVLCFFLS